MRIELMGGEDTLHARLLDEQTSGNAAGHIPGHGHVR